MNINELKPARVFEQFAKINAIPRPSKHEEKMIDYLKQFGKTHGLETDRQRHNTQASHKRHGKQAHRHIAEPHGHGMRQTRRRRHRLPE